MVNVKPNFVDVHPSSDQTGATDTHKLQAAIDAVTTVGNTMTVGCVRVSGHYFVNKPLRIGGVSANAEVPPVSLLGVGHAKITYVGPAMDDYVLRYLGVSWVCDAGLQHITVDCRKNARGVLVCGQRYFGNVEGLHIIDPRKVGLDSIDCWASSWRNVHVQRALGYAARFYRCNATNVQSLRVLGWPSDWPAATDTACIDSAGQPYRTSERAALHISNCTGLIISNLICEGCNYDDCPVIWWHGKNCLLERPYFEANHIHNELIHMRGSRGWGRRNAIRGASMCDTQCRAFVRLIGGTADNVIEQCSYAGLFSQAVVIQEGTSHANNLIVQSSHDGIPDLITETAGGIA